MVCDNINFGYCCINTELRKKKIFTSRTCRLATIQKNGIEHSYALARQNLADLKDILKWNHDNGIFLFRVSSSMFPFGSHPAKMKEQAVFLIKKILENEK
jgi:UV DNA damage endonuclease